MIITGYNNRVPCKPPLLEGAKLDVSSGFGRLQHRSAITGLKVLYSVTDIPAGSTVYVRQPENQVWAKDKFSIDGEEFVLVPLDQVLLVKFE